MSLGFPYSYYVLLHHDRYHPGIIIPRPNPYPVPYPPFRIRGPRRVAGHITSCFKLKEKPINKKSKSYETSSANQHPNPPGSLRTVVSSGSAGEVWKKKKIVSIPLFRTTNLENKIMSVFKLSSVVTVHPYPFVECLSLDPPTRGNFDRPTRSQNGFHEPFILTSDLHATILLIEEHYDVVSLRVGFQHPRQPR